MRHPSSIAALLAAIVVSVASGQAVAKKAKPSPAPRPGARDTVPDLDWLRRGDQYRIQRDQQSREAAQDRSFERNDMRSRLRGTMGLRP